LASHNLQFCFKDRRITRPGLGIDPISPAREGCLLHWAVGNAAHCAVTLAGDVVAAANYLENRHLDVATAGAVIFNYRFKRVQVGRGLYWVHETMLNIIATVTHGDDKFLAVRYVPVAGKIAERASDFEFLILLRIRDAIPGGFLRPSCRGSFASLVVIAMTN
jgi:hypothetical protein